MRIIDKLIICALAILFLLNTKWENTLPMLPILAIIYSIIYLIYRGVNDEILKNK